MKEFMKKLFISAAIVLTSISAHAEFVDGNKLLSWLNSPEDDSRALGMGYVAGAFDTASGSQICAPGNVSVKQVVDMTKEALNSIPELRHRSADQFVIAAASRVWPCKQKSRGSNV